MAEQRRRILIVEDQRVGAADLENTLQRLGYAVVGNAASSEEAVQKAVDLEPELILMDIRLRDEMDGIEAAQQIRARADIPIVYLTAYAEEETLRRAKVTGPFGYVVEPFNERELRAAIEIALYKQDADRALAEERARRAVAEESRLLIESVADYAIFRLDPEGRVVSWNAGAERIKGYAASEVIGKSFARFFVPEEVEADRPSALLDRARREGRATYEGWRLRKDGTRYWANVSVTAIRDDDGLQGFAIIVRDMTERRLAEESLQEADHQKDWFIAMLGHELRNPLAAIRTATEILKLAPDDEAVRARTQSVLERQTLHMARLIDDLLDVSRIVRGKIRVQKETVDLGAVLREAVHDRLGEVGARGLEIETDISEDPMWVEGDRVRLAQVIHNLLGNAIRFTDPPGKITVTAEPDGGDAVVTVRDTGIGIDPDLLPNVFEPFRQGAQSLDRGFGGLGLGLAIVKGVLELHGGTVRAHTEGRGRGSAFTIRVPIAAKRAVEQPPSRAEAPRRRILIVEDNADAADLLCALLCQIGHEVGVAYDGESALELARSFDPDVVLCDIGLPAKLNGYDVARALREQKGNGKPFLVALTGYGRPEDVARAHEAGFDAHLAKPANLAAIDALLRRSAEG